MAKERTEEEQRLKKEKKEKRASTTSEAGIKKEKKDKKRKSTDATTQLLNTLETEKPGSVAVDEDGDVIVDAEPVESKQDLISVPLAALVPFANPLCDEKSGKKVLKTVKKAAKAKALKRGVKEVVKSVRKSPAANPSTLSQLPPGIVVLAADISPMDVISHLPVLCEDHNIPYVYLPSRAELGAAGATKRPTSVVMVAPKCGKKDATEEEIKEWEEAYKEFHRLAIKLGQGVKV